MLRNSNYIMFDLPDHFNVMLSTSKVYFFVESFHLGHIRNFGIEQELQAFNGGSDHAREYH